MCLMMQYLTGIGHNQMVFTSFAVSISEDNRVCFIDAFVKKYQVLSEKREIVPKKARDAPKLQKKVVLLKHCLMYRQSKNENCHCEEEVRRLNNLQVQKRVLKLGFATLHFVPLATLRTVF